MKFKLDPSDVRVRRPMEAVRQDKAPAPPREPSPLPGLLKKVLAVALPLLGILILAWRMQPARDFNPPTSDVTTRDVRVQEQEGMPPVLEGEVVNDTDRTAKKIVFQVTYKMDGADRTTYVSVHDVPAHGVTAFKVPLVVVEDGEKAVVKPGGSKISGKPVFTPFDSEW